MNEDDDQNDLFMCTLSSNDSADGERRQAERREAELAAYRARRAKRIAELGLGSHRKDP
jgi:hypothetical protein